LSREALAIKEVYMLDSAFEAALAAGAIVGAVLVATILVVPFVRYAVLIATTSVIVVIYLRGGVADLVTFISALQAEMAGRPTFSAGMIAGMVLVAFALGRPRGRAAK
jgi:hypothetical protein